MSSVHELTPVELHRGTWYKRDDLHRPFPFVPISGGKIRQCSALLEANRDVIRARGGVVLTAGGVHSPQALIVTACAEALGLRCVVFVGASSLRGALSHTLIARAVRLGATLDTFARVAYEPAIARRIEHWRDEHDGQGFVVRFGMNVDTDPAALLDTTAEQVRNVPRSVRTIVVPVGSGITAAGILRGVERYRSESVERVVLVQIAGYDRRRTIDRLAGGAAYDYATVDGVPYSKLVRRCVDGITLDPVYEAKAHDWMRQAGLSGEHTLFWIVGDSTDAR